ncbi:pericentrin-like protein isoform X3 [Haematobia irritans]|uniref:pericentrin-like protein isoform X3 n=1 Tax=Haematobia irritans TaxID=7368 RepID=UPI003F508CE4
MDLYAVYDWITSLLRPKATYKTTPIATAATTNVAIHPYLVSGQGNSQSGIVVYAAVDENNDPNGQEEDNAHVVYEETKINNIEFIPTLEFVPQPTTTPSSPCDNLQQCLAACQENNEENSQLETKCIQQHESATCSPLTFTVDKTSENTGSVLSEEAAAAAITTEAATLDTSKKDSFSSLDDTSELLRQEIKRISLSSLSTYFDEPTSSISIEMMDGSQNNTTSGHITSVYTTTSASGSMSTASRNQTTSHSNVPQNFTNPPSSISEHDHSDEIEEEIEEALEISSGDQGESLDILPGLASSGKALEISSEDQGESLDILPGVSRKNPLASMKADDEMFGIEFSDKSSSIEISGNRSASERKAPKSSSDDNQFKIDDDQLSGGKLAQHFVLDEDEDNDGLDLPLATPEIPISSRDSEESNNQVQSLSNQSTSHDVSELQEEESKDDIDSEDSLLSEGECHISLPEGNAIKPYALEEVDSAQSSLNIPILDIPHGGESDQEQIPRKWDSSKGPSSWDKITPENSKILEKNDSSLLQLKNRGGAKLITEEMTQERDSGSTKNLEKLKTQSQDLKMVKVSTTRMESFGEDKLSLGHLDQDHSQASRSDQEKLENLQTDKAPSTKGGLESLGSQESLKSKQTKESLKSDEGKLEYRNTPKGDTMASKTPEPWKSGASLKSALDQPNLNNPQSLKTDFAKKDSLPQNLKIMPEDMKSGDSFKSSLDQQILINPQSLKTDLEKLDNLRIGKITPMEASEIPQVLRTTASTPSNLSKPHTMAKDHDQKLEIQESKNVPSVGEGVDDPEKLKQQNIVQASRNIVSPTSPQGIKYSPCLEKSPSARDEESFDYDQSIKSSSLQIPSMDSIPMGSISATTSNFTPISDQFSPVAPDQDLKRSLTKTTLPELFENPNIKPLSVASSPYSEKDQSMEEIIRTNHSMEMTFDDNLSSLNPSFIDNNETLVNELLENTSSKSKPEGSVSNDQKENTKTLPEELRHIKDSNVVDTVSNDQKENTKTLPEELRHIKDSNVVDTVSNDQKEGTKTLPQEPRPIKDSNVVVRTPEFPKPLSLELLAAEEAITSFQELVPQQMEQSDHDLHYATENFVIPDFQQIESCGELATSQNVNMEIITDLDESLQENEGQPLTSTKRNGSARGNPENLQDTLRIDTTNEEAEDDDDEEDEEDTSLQLMKLRIMAMKHHQQKDTTQQLSPTAETANTTSSEQQNVKAMERVSLVEFSKDVLEDITEESERNSLSTQEEPQSLEKIALATLASKLEAKAAAQNDNESGAASTTNSMVSLNMVQMLEQKVGELQQMLATKDACLASLNMQLENMNRRESIDQLGSVSGRETSSLVTNSTEYRTFQEDFGQPTMDIYMELSKRDELIAKLTDSLQQSLTIRENLQSESEKLSTEVQLLRKQLTDAMDTLKRPCWPRIDQESNFGQRISEISMDLISESDDDFDRHYFTDNEEKFSRNSRERQLSMPRQFEYATNEPEIISTPFSKQIEQFQKYLTPSEVRLFFMVQKKFDDYLSQELEKCKMKNDQEMKIVMDQWETEKREKDEEIQRLLNQRQEREIKHNQEMENLRKYFEAKCADLEKHQPPEKKENKKFSDDVFSQKSQRQGMSSSESSDQEQLSLDYKSPSLPRSKETSPRKRYRAELLLSPSHRQMTPGNDAYNEESHTNEGSQLALEITELKRFYQNKIHEIQRSQEDNFKKLSDKVKYYESRYPEDEFMSPTKNSTLNRTQDSSTNTEDVTQQTVYNVSQSHDPCPQLLNEAMSFNTSKDLAKEKAASSTANTIPTSSMSTAATMSSSSPLPLAQNNNNNNNTSLIIIDTDELNTNNETQIIQKIIDEYERRLQEQLALAREDIVHELEQQIQTLLSESTADDQHWPKELILLREKFTAKSQLEIAQLQIKHAEEMSRLKQDYEKQLNRKNKRHSTFDSIRDFDKLLSERDNLRDLSNAFRQVLAELLKCVANCENDLNDALVEEVQRLLTCNRTLEEHASLGDLNRTLLNETLNETLNSTRMRLMPDVHTLMGVIEDPSLVQYVSQQNNDFIEEDFDLKDCLECLRSEASYLLHLSEDLAKKHNESNNSRKDSYTSEKEKNDTDQEDDLKLQQNRKFIRVNSLNEQQLPTHRSSVLGQQQQNLISLPPDLNRLYEDNYSSTAGGVNAAELHFQLTELKNRLIKSENDRLQLQQELDLTISRNSDLGQELQHLRDQLSQLSSINNVEYNEGYGLGSSIKSPHRLSASDNSSSAGFAQLQEKARNILSTPTQKQQSNDSTVQLLQMIEDFCREGDKVVECSKKDREDLQSQVEHLESQIRDLTQHLHESNAKRDKFEVELKASIDKIFVLREIISDLETQVETKALNEHVMGEKVKQLEEYLNSQSHSTEALQMEVQSLKGEIEHGYQARINQLEEKLQNIRPPAEQSLIMDQVVEQLRDIESTLEQKTKVLESLHQSNASSVASLSCPEDISARGVGPTTLPTNVDTPPQGSPVHPSPRQHSWTMEGVQRVVDKLSKHSRVEEAAIKRIRDLEMQVNQMRTACVELQYERESLQERMSEQTQRISALQSRLEEQRQRAEELQRANTSDLNIRIHDLQNELQTAKETLSNRDKQISTMKQQLEKSKVAIDRLEAELAVEHQPDRSTIERLENELKLKQGENQKLKDKIKNEMINKLALPDLMETMLADKNEEIDHLKEQLECKENELQNALRDCTHSSSMGVMDKKPDDMVGKLSARTLSDIVSISEFDEPDVVRRAAVANTSSPLLLPAASDGFLQNTMDTSKGAVANLTHKRTEDLTGFATTLHQANTFDHPYYFQDPNILLGSAQSGATATPTLVPRQINFSEFSDDSKLKTPGQLQTPPPQDQKSTEDKSAIEILQNHGQELQRKIDALLKEKEQNSEDLISSQLRLNGLQDELQRCQQELLKFKENAQKIRDLEQKLLEKSMELDQLLRAQEKWQKEKTELLSKHEKNLKNLQESEESYKQRINELEEAMLKNTEKEVNEKESLRKELRAISEVHEQCQYMAKDNENRKKEIENFNKEIKAKDERLLTLSSKLSIAEEKITDLQRQVLNLEREVEKLKQQSSDNSSRQFSVDEIAQQVEKELNYSAQLDSNILKAIESEEENNLDRSHVEKNVVIEAPGTTDDENFTGERDLLNQLEALKTQIAVERDHADELRKELMEEKQHSQEVQEQDVVIIEAMRKRLESALAQEDELHKHLDIEREKCERLQTQLTTLQRTESRRNSSLLKSPTESPRKSPRSLTDFESELAERLRSEIKLLTAQNERERERSADLQRNSERERCRYEKELSERIEYCDKLKREMDKVARDKDNAELEIDHLQERLTLQTQEIESLEARIGSLQAAETRRFTRKDQHQKENAQLMAEMQELKAQLQLMEAERESLNHTITQLRCDIERSAHREGKLAEALANANAQLAAREGTTSVPEQFLEKMREINTLLAENTQENKQMAETVQYLVEERRQLQRKCEELESQVNGSANVAELEERCNHLLGRYLRVESHRKALVYQKRYLKITLQNYQDSEQRALAAFNGGHLLQPPKPKKKLFKTVALAIIAIQRMKYIGRIWHTGKRIVSKSVFTITQQKRSQAPSVSSAVISSSSQQTPTLVNGRLSPHIYNPLRTMDRPLAPLKTPTLLNGGSKTPLSAASTISPGATGTTTAFEWPKVTNKKK